MTYAEIGLELKQGTERLRWRTVIAIADQPWEEAILGFRGFLEYFDINFLTEALEIEMVKNGLTFET